MADLVNQTAKDRLSQRNSEPSHLAKVPYKEIGGRRIDTVANDAEGEVTGEADDLSADTTIPKSVPGEKTHLTTVIDAPPSKDTDDVDLDFGDEAVDDIDEALDQFEEVEPVDIEIKSDEDDEKASADNEKKDDDLKEDEEIVIKSGGGKDDEKASADKEKSDDDEEGGGKGKPPWLNKEDLDYGSGRSPEEATKLSRTAVDSGPNKETGEEGANLEEDDVAPYQEGEMEKVEANAKDPAAALDKKGGMKAEALKIRIKLPNTNLFESAGVPKKAQARVGVVFESVIKDVTKQISTQVSAHYRKLHEQKLARRDAILAKQMDSYLNYVVEEWVTTNKVAIRTSLRSQLAEEFLGGLQRLFTEHYIDVPESKVDVVKTLTKQVSALKTSLNEQVAQKLKLRSLAEAANKARIVAQFARSQRLSEAQIVKLEKLAESTAYTTAKEFREKLTMLSESYFPKPQKNLRHLEEENLGTEETVKTTKSHADPAVAAAMAASVALGNKDAW
jgi:hypothetical protein